jgi:phage repressor protein C with HTH and peptisase S24 domain
MIFYLFTIFGIVVIILLWAFFKNYTVARVSGDSMFPTYKNKEIILIKKRAFKLEIGKVYAFYDPDNRLVIKRLKYTHFTPITGDFLLYFVGDNPANSYDSISYGFIKSSMVIGKIIKIGGKGLDV